MSFDPTNRELCPDGSCIGVIGPDGRCNECGAVASSANTHSRLRGMELDADGDSEAEAEASDFEGDRELCPDGSCIGLIGPDGRCRECGRVAGPRSRGDDDDDEADDDEADDEPDSDRAAAAAADGDGGYDPDDIDQRELCPDGSCIGVIGADGRCRECGQPAR